MNTKVFAYELMDEIPLSTLELYHQNPDNPNSLEDVAKKLVASHLPAWLTYAITESDHEITDIPTKTIEHIDNETIQDVAKRYGESDSHLINLARPGEYDWMSEDSMKPFREEFDEQYNTAVQSIISVLKDMFQSDEQLEIDFSDQYVEKIATSIVNSVDMFQWELLRQNVPESSEDANRHVAEWLISSFNESLFIWDYLLEMDVEMSKQTLSDKLEEHEPAVSQIEEAFENESLAENPSVRISWEETLPNNPIVNILG